MKRALPRPVRVAVFLLLVFGFFAFVPLSSASDFFLHSSTSHFLDNTSPTATTAKFKDSAAVNRTTYQEIGTWAAAAAASAIGLNSLGDLHIWIGLKNSDDQGTYFDLRAELRKNGVAIASGETKTIQGVTRNPSNAKEVTVSFGAISDNQFNPGDVLSLRILTKVADSGGHNNAVGLRLYYDAVSRPSRFDAVFVVDNTPPTIAATVNPAPNAAGWHKSDVTVSFTCADSESGVASCPGPITVSTEAANQLISGTATDQAGNSAATSVTLSIDKTPPAVAISSPANGATLGSFPATVTGTITETLSGIANIGCNGNPTTLSGSIFTCNVPLVDGANTIVVDSIDVAGNAGSASVSVNFVSGPTITITSPAPGSVVNSSTVLVRGLVDVPAGTEVGVSVNGFATSLNGNQWAVDVPVVAGGQTISAVALSITGAQATDTITIDATQAPAPIFLRAAPLSGVAPLTVSWLLVNQTGRSLVQFELDENGSGVFGPPTANFDGVQTIYTTPGIYVPVLRVTDDQGVIYTATTAVDVEDPVVVTARFRNLWNSFKGRLTAGDIQGALNHLAPVIRSRFEAVFQQLGTSLPAVAAGFDNLEVLEQLEDIAEAIIVQQENGSPRLYFIYYRRDSLGRWLIEEM